MTQEQYGKSPAIAALLDIKVYNALRETERIFAASRFVEEKMIESVRK